MFPALKLYHSPKRASLPLSPWEVVSEVPKHIESLIDASRTSKLHQVNGNRENRQELLWLHLSLLRLLLSRNTTSEKIATILASFGEETAHAEQLQWVG
jgi:hypothetical protein